MKKVLASVLATIVVVIVGATAGNAQSISRPLALNSLPTDLYTSTYLTLEQPSLNVVQDVLTCS